MTKKNLCSFSDEDMDNWDKTAGGGFRLDRKYFRETGIVRAKKWVPVSENKKLRVILEQYDYCNMAPTLHFVLFELDASKMWACWHSYWDYILSGYPDNVKNSLTFIHDVTNYRNLGDGECIRIYKEIRRQKPWIGSIREIR